MHIKPVMHKDIQDRSWLSLLKREVSGLQGVEIKWHQ